MQQSKITASNTIDCFSVVVLTELHELICVNKNQESYRWRQRHVHNGAYRGLAGKARHSNTNNI